MSTSLAVAISLLASLTACGGEAQQRQAPIAVRVANEAISQSAVRQTLNREWPMSPDMGGKKVRPPKFSACLEATRRTPARLSRLQCRGVYEAHEHFAIRWLIQASWSRLAARALGLEPARATLNRLFEKQVDRYAPSLARRIRASDRLQQKVSENIFRVERDKLIAEALKTTPEKLPHALARRYKRQTHCGEKYRVVEVPECTGALARQ